MGLEAIDWMRENERKLVSCGYTAQKEMKK